MDVLRAVADGTRLAILKRLARGELCACKLPKLTGRSQPNVSKHLRVLLEAGLITVREEGTKRLYSLSAKGKRVIRDISEW
jgi:DNA-binding transcriptional ArsR family regulator